MTLARVFDAMLALYQKTLSPDHGVFSFYFPYGYCRYTPTCSMYAREAIRQKGLVFGLFYTFHRILRCNPFSAGGSDPVIKQPSKTL